MGNCCQKQKKNNKKFLAEIAPADEILSTQKLSPPTVILYGDPTNNDTHYLRFALHYKPLTLRFIPTPITQQFTVRFESDDPISGSLETILDYVESKVPRPSLHNKGAEEKGFGETMLYKKVVSMLEIQHKSMRWHLERVVRWGLDMAKRGGVGAVDPGVGTPKMEVSKFGKSYGMLLEMLLEHAQMEERVIFPLLQASDPGVCRCVNEEHARDLPVMNGIKEDIKSVGVLNAGTSTHREALNSLSARLQTLQENCREHFEEEERSLFPLMEAADMTQNQRKKIVEQCINVMQGTHSHLFGFFIQGLLPHEAMEYLHLLMTCLDKETTSALLRVLVEDVALLSGISFLLLDFERR